MLVVRRRNTEDVEWAARNGVNKEGEDKIIVMAPDGRQIVFQVMSVEGGRVKIGVVAPLDYNITRAELRLRPDKQQGEYYGKPDHRQTYRH